MRWMSAVVAIFLLLAIGISSQAAPISQSQTPQVQAAVVERDRDVLQATLKGSGMGQSQAEQILSALTGDEVSILRENPGMLSEGEWKMQPPPPGPGPWPPPPPFPLPPPGPPGPLEPWFWADYWIVGGLATVLCCTVVIAIAVS